jgi:hypothetical protein
MSKMVDNQISPNESMNLTHSDLINKREQDQRLFAGN